MAEIIKYGLIRDPELFAWLEANIEKVRGCIYTMCVSCAVSSYRQTINRLPFLPLLLLSSFLLQVINRDPAALAFAIKRSCENKVRIHTYVCTCMHMHADRKQTTDK